MNAIKLWDYLKRTIKDGIVDRKLFNYITRHYGSILTSIDVEKAYQKGYYEGLQVVIKKTDGKLSDQK